MTDEVKLHVGYVGRTRDGKRVEITKMTSNSHPFFGYDNGHRSLDGSYWYDGENSNHDIIGPWTEPTAEYPVGQWIGWNGGECPVHPQDEVQVRLLSQAHGHTLISAVAGDFDWRTKLYHNSIESFRIVNPHVEPKKPLECWVNIYSSGKPGFHETKEKADKMATAGRIRCVRMVEADQ